VHAGGEEAVAATLNTPPGKEKQVVYHREGSSSRFKNKNKTDKRHRYDNLVKAVERKASRPKGNPTKVGPSKDHFEMLLEAPCTHHKVLTKHALKDYRLMKNYVNGTLKTKTADPQKKAAPHPDNDDDDAGAEYPGEDGVVHMIFGGSPARLSRRQEELIRRGIYNIES
jgi:hypothetical protein